MITQSAAARRVSYQLETLWDFDCEPAHKELESLYETARRTSGTPPPRSIGAVPWARRDRCSTCTLPSSDELLLAAEPPHPVAAVVAVP